MLAATWRITAQTCHTSGRTRADLSVPVVRHTAMLYIYIYIYDAHIYIYIYIILFETFPRTLNVHCTLKHLFIR